MSALARLSGSQMTLIYLILDILLSAEKNTNSVTENMSRFSIWGSSQDVCIVEVIIVLLEVIYL